MKRRIYLAGFCLVAFCVMGVGNSERVYADELAESRIEYTQYSSEENALEDSKVEEKSEEVIEDSDNKEEKKENNQEIVSENNAVDSANEETKGDSSDSPAGFEDTEKLIQPQEDSQGNNQENLQEAYTMVVIDGKKYLKKGDGSFYTGWYDMPPYGRLYFDPLSGGAALVGGPYTIDENGTPIGYYFNEDGVLIVNSQLVANGNKYQSDENGHLLQGWVNVGPWTFYFDPETYIATTGVRNIDNKLFLFSINGDLYKTPGHIVVDNNKYAINYDYTLLTGWTSCNGIPMYFDETTGVCAKGLWGNPGSYRFFDDNGLQIGVGDSYQVMYKGHKMFFDKGLVKTGWIDYGDWRFYVDPATGFAVSGLNTIDGKKYLFSNHCDLYKSPGHKIINGHKYNIASDGSLVLGWVPYGQYMMYFNEENGICITNMVWPKGVFNGDGVYIFGEGQVVYGGKKYLFKDGDIQLGWQQMGPFKMYFDKSYGYAVTGVCNIDGKTYYFTDDGCLGDDLYAKAAAVLNKIGWDLRAAFNWSRSLPYTKEAGYPDAVPAGLVHSRYYANMGFTNLRGHCYVMAATFVYMARVLGYEAYFIEGQVPYRSGFRGHGWCELVVNGKTYVCDPDFTYNTGRNGFMINYKQPGTWVYANYARVA